MRDVNAVLSALVVVALVLVVLLLGVKTYTTGSGLDGGWVTLLCLVFGAVLGVPSVRRAREQQEAEQAKKRDEQAKKQDEEGPKNET